MIYPSEEEKPPRFQKPLLVAAAVAVVALFAGAGWYVYTELFTSKEPPPVVTPSTLESQAERLPERVEGRYLFTGTTVWARAVEKYARGDFAQPFSQLHTLEREKYDAWSTDFECPITENVVPYDVQVNNLVFNCRPEFLPEASKYFNLYDLANNHTDNQGGQTGITSTRASMEKAGVQYFGNYDPTITEDICEVIALPVRVQLPDGGVVRLAYADTNGHPYQSIGRWLADRGELRVEQASMDGIKNWARANPSRLQEMLNANPSYIFFREVPNNAGGPVGALGQPLTDGRSLAVVPRSIPLGAPVSLATTHPNSAQPLRRLMLAQDTGSAIKGGVRGDFYWGFGAEAGALAGRMRQKGEMWVLWPRDQVPR